jgi:hypothetical protein
VRVVRDIYPPKITLAFRLTDAADNILVQGDRVLTDLDFLMHLSPIGMDDPRRHEKALIDDWLRKEFGMLKGTRTASRE